MRRALDEPPLPARMIEFLADESSGYELFSADSWREFLCDDEELINSLDLSPRSPLFGLYSSWFFHFWSPTPGRHQLNNPSLFGVPPTQHFLACHPQLESSVRDYLRACLRSEYSFYEILSCRPGRGVSCRDVFSGQVVKVASGDQFEKLKPGLVMYLNLVPIEGITMLEATGPFATEWPDEKLPDFLHQLALERSTVLDRSTRLRLLYLLLVQGSCPAYLFPTGLSS